MSSAPSQPSDNDGSNSNVDLPPQLDLTTSISKADDQHATGGAFGDVYRCRYTRGSASTEVAVKAFRFRIAMDGNTGDTYVEMRRRELGIWRRLAHANVVPFLGIAYGFGRANAVSLVSLWMPNGSLHDLLVKQDDSLNVAHRLQMLLDISNGLHYLHSQQIVHGNLSCNNVLLDTDYTARLTDYSYAAFVGNTPKGLSYLQRATRQGAVRWTAPEQIASGDLFHKTPESDIYSFGCISFQVLSGKKPWSELQQDAVVVLRLAMGEKPSRPESRSIDDSHWDLIQHCWSPKEERPTTGMIMPTVQKFLDNCPPSRPLRDLLIPQSDNTASLRDSVSLFGRGYLDPGFTKPRISALEMMGDDASSARKYEDALKAYSDALSLSPSVPHSLLSKWARALSSCVPATEALTAATTFKPPRFDIYQAICDALEMKGSIEEAIKCFRCMHDELGNTSIHDERAKWEQDFQRRCAARLEKLGDAAMDSQKYDEATEHFSAVLSLGEVDHAGILNKWSKAWMSMGKEIIKLDSSHRGNEERHEEMGYYGEALRTLEIALSELEQSPDRRIQELHRQYVNATSRIQQTIQQTTHLMPLVLIDTATGHLYDKSQQATAFEELTAYKNLRCTMTIQFDDARIREEIKHFYRYVMFSHRWKKEGEPSYKVVKDASIYGLDSSPANVKLRKFCELVRSLGFRWAWSDTCCIDREGEDKSVLQESLVAMFSWYQGSSLTIVHLWDVWSQSQQPGDLEKSDWNTRVWTYQEYVAANVIRFYTADWKPYLGLTPFNHKKCRDVISEMQHVTGVSAEGLAALCPGYDRVREKLSMASVRQTTLVEDFAYSLIGIFNISIPIIYGEGYHAVGRLLEHVLTGSGDVTILAWTGTAGEYNSCLPGDLTVYSKPVPPHVPQPIKQAEMNSFITTLHSSLDHALAKTLYKYLKNLLSPSLYANRLLLPGIIFRLPKIDHAPSPDSVSNLHVYQVVTPALGNVEIKTTSHLIGPKDLFLVHPWIRPLLNQERSDGANQMDELTRALRFVARLRQSFGALLFQRLPNGMYKRVAMDCLITVQIQENVLLTEMIDNIRTIEVR